MASTSSSLHRAHAARPGLILPAEVISESPSRREGVADEVEISYRIAGCELIQEMGILLRLPQVVMATAQTLFHRFYYRKSLTQFDTHIVAIAALFLGAKVEEAPRRFRDVINVAYHCKLRRQGKPPKPILLGGNVRYCGRRFCDASALIYLARISFLISQSLTSHAILVAAALRSLEG